MTSEADVVLCDTSGRLHTNDRLMEELAKCKRSVGKRLPGAPHEILLVLDGTTGEETCVRACKASCCFGMTCDQLDRSMTSPSAAMLFMQG